MMKSVGSVSLLGLILLAAACAPALARSHNAHPNEAMGTDPRCTVAAFAKNHPKLCLSTQANSSTTTPKP